MRRLTVAQALVRFLAAQYTERDGVQQRLIAGCFGIFGHGNVAGVGQALLEAASPTRMPYYHGRNEQGDGPRRGRLRAHEQPAVDARVHDVHRPRRDEHGHGRGARDDQPPAGAAAARRHVRHPRGAARCCRSSRTRRSLDVSVNDAFRPVSRFFDRIERPEQLVAGALAAMRVLTDPVETGAVTLALPQDVQAEAFDWPEELFERARLARAPPAARAARRWPGPPTLLRGARRPLIVSGGGDDLRRGDRRAARARRGDRHPRRGDAGRQGLAPLRPPAGRRRDRRDRHHGRQRARPRGRRRARGRHALERLHDRLAQRLRGPGRALRQPQRRAGRRVQARRPPARRRRAARARGARARRSRAGRRPRAHRARPRARGASGTRRSSGPTRSAHAPLPAQSAR